MSLVIATIIGAAVLHGGTPAPSEAPVAAAAGGYAPVRTSGDPLRAASLDAARAWLALPDDGRWRNSWRAASRFFQDNAPTEQWTSAMQAARQPLGAVLSRRFLNVTQADALPGAPAGTYEVIQFRTDLAGKNAAVETITLVRDGDTWKTAGYFIR